MPEPVVNHQHQDQEPHKLEGAKDHRPIRILADRMIEVCSRDPRNISRSEKPEKRAIFSEQMQFGRSRKIRPGKCLTPVGPSAQNSERPARRSSRSLKPDSGM